MPIPSNTAQKPELLAPAGSPEAFVAALAAGADAIYGGMGTFNARRKAENFTDESFAEACRSAHVAGARVYVTVNVVIKDEEMPQALELVQRGAMLGADAFIIQDWGLFFEVRRLMPQLETHISTQANIHDARGCIWARDAGANRVTLSRELSIEEIGACAAAGVELEAFAHGSICMSYSGLCMLSGMVSTTAEGRRSANRGLCAQPCRLPYELVDSQGRTCSAPGRDRALCPRDNCTIDLLPHLVDAGVHALKLEGRMKAPEYVYAVVDAYRNQLDEVLARQGAAAAVGDAPENGTAAPAPAKEGMNRGGAPKRSSSDDVPVPPERMRQLKRAFNRDFTSSYQHGRSGDEMMSYERSNNRGQVVGVVVGSRPQGNTRGLHPDDRRRRAAIVSVRLCEPVGAGDLLELRHDANWDQFLTAPVTAAAEAGTVIEVRAARSMPQGACARVIRSQAALDATSAALKRPVPRKRAVDVRVRARRGEPFEVTLSCSNNPTLTASASGFVVEPARTRAVSPAELAEHVCRMGSSPFEVASIEVELDAGCGMGFSAVHKVRSDACAALERCIRRPYEKRAEALAALPPFEKTALSAGNASRGALPLSKSAGNPRSQAEGCMTARSSGRADANFVPKAKIRPLDTTQPHADTGEICALATSAAAANAARDAGAARIYMGVDALLAAGFSPAEAAAQSIVPVLDEVCRMHDHQRLDAWTLPGAPVAVGNISELALAAERNAAAEVRSCLPVHNLACLHALAIRGACAFWLSPELTLKEIETLGHGAAMLDDCAPALGLAVIGRVRVMTTEHCILQVANRCIHDCARCELRHKHLALKNIDGKLLPVRTDVHGRSRLYDARPFDLTPQIPQLLEAGVSRFMVDGTLMEPDELARMVRRAQRALNEAHRGQTPAKRLQNHSSGCLFDGVL